MVVPVFWLHLGLRIRQPMVLTTHGRPKEYMRGNMKPGFTVSAEGILRRAENVRVAGEDCNCDSRNGDRLCPQIWKHEDGKKMLVGEWR